MVSLNPFSRTLPATVFVYKCDGLSSIYFGFLYFFSGQGDKIHHLATLALGVYLDPVLYNVSFQDDVSLSQSQKSVLRVSVYF